MRARARSVGGRVLYRLRSGAFSARGCAKCTSGDAFSAGSRPTATVAILFASSLSWSIFCFSAKRVPRASLSARAA
eukprot:672980-Lingulodinium_polyedra.AAC.1